MTQKIAIEAIGEEVISKAEEIVEEANKIQGPLVKYVENQGI